MICGKYKIRPLDSEHFIGMKRLRGNAELHRFNNGVGVEYSAIYLDGIEVLSCERAQEEKMIKYWNDSKTTISFK